VKKIEATISPFRLDQGKDTLKDHGISGITVSEVQNFLPASGSAFTPQLMIEVVVPDEICLSAIEAIREAGEIRETAYSQVFAMDLAEVVRIRTSERGATAI